MSPPDKTFKLQPFLLQSEFDLALVDPISITLQMRAYRPLAPLNLRVAGDGYNPTYATGADIVADWDKAANRSSEDPVTKVLNPDIDQTVLEVLTRGAVLKGVFEFSGGQRTADDHQRPARGRAGNRDRFQAAGLVRPQRAAKPQI